MTNHVNMSTLSEALSSTGKWEDLVVWDEDIYDPIFHGDTSFTGVSAECNDRSALAYKAPESVTSEPQYIPSAPGSILDGHSSFEYDAVSGPPSIIDGQSSLGNAFSWLSTSTSATSPVLSREMHRTGSSFNAYEDTLSQRDSPVLDTRQERIPRYIGSYGRQHPDVFNPYLAGSPYAFSGLDVNASHAFSSVGTWADQPQIVEPISESEYTEVGASPIPIPLPSYGSSLGSLLRSEEQLEVQNHARALDIPQPNRRTENINLSHPPPQWSHQVPPVLSGSPVARRRNRSVALSRSNSRNESRRKITTPSPTSSFGWVSYQPSAQQGRLVPSGGDGSQGRRQRGRTRGLTLEQRRNAALMRVVGACSNCKRRKEKCDPGIPCKSCLDHYKGDLVHHPCRDRLLSDLSRAFLSDRLGWHPTNRPLESFAPNGFDIGTGITYIIPLTFGFGPSLHLPVHAIRIIEDSSKYHQHIIYPWPPGSSTGDLHIHAVLPAVISNDAELNLLSTLDTHLSLLVTQHFRSFPLYCSPLRMLREIYVYYRSLPTNSSHSQTLHQALKLLVLVHIGGDITLPTPDTDPVLAQLVRTTLDVSEDITPTPCFIRAQFGSVMPKLAMSLMKDVLSSLEQTLLNRECHEWPIALAVLTTLLMTVESIHYHAAKLPYHHNYDAHRRSNHGTEEDFKLDDEAVKTLLAFYSACFSGCHVRLRPEWEGEAIPEWDEMKESQNSSPDDQFIESVREAIKRASPGGYIVHKANDERQGDDMGFFFDRLAARLLLLKTT